VIVYHVQPPTRENWQRHQHPNDRREAIIRRGSGLIKVKVTVTGVVVAVPEVKLAFSQVGIPVI
jgi:hypothetical protein